MKRSRWAISSRTTHLTTELTTGQPSRAALRKSQWYTAPEDSSSKTSTPRAKKANCRRLNCNTRTRAVTSWVIMICMVQLLALHF